MRTTLISILTAFALTACGDNNNPNREAPEVLVLHGEAACTDYPEMPAEVQPWHCCNDGMNNDGDLWTDTDDEDCRDYNMENPPEDLDYETGFCNDHTDNDGDGDIDCEDQDCMTDPACTVPENEDEEEDEVDTSDEDEEDDNNNESDYRLTFGHDGCESGDVTYLAIITESGAAWPEDEDFGLVDACNGSVRVGLNTDEGEVHLWVYTAGFRIYNEDGYTFQVWANGEEANGNYDNWPSWGSDVTVDDYSATPGEYGWYNIMVEVP
jgi:hypothetical protein